MHFRTTAFSHSPRDERREFGYRSLWSRLLVRGKLASSSVVPQSDIGTGAP